MTIHHLDRLLGERGDYPAHFFIQTKAMFTTMKTKITNTTVAALNGLTGLGFLGVITLVMLAKSLRERNEE